MHVCVGVYVFLPVLSFPMFAENRSPPSLKIDPRIYFMPRPSREASRDTEILIYFKAGYPGLYFML